MKYTLMILTLLIVNINAKTTNEYTYEKCMESDIKKRSMVTADEEKELKRKRSKEESLKEEIELEEILTKRLLEIKIIETKTTKTLMIKNKSHCVFDINFGTMNIDELRKLKEFGESIKIKEKDEVNITIIKK